jgi:hypothetical protein
VHEPIPVDAAARPVGHAKTGRVANYWQTPPAEMVEWARPAVSTEVEASRRAAVRRASRRALLQRRRTSAARS